MDTNELDLSSSMEEEETIVILPRAKTDAKEQPKGETKEEISNSFTVNKNYLKLSKLVSTAIENDKEAKELELDQVSPQTFEHIKNYLEHHKGVAPEIIPQPLKSNVMAEVCKDPWDAKFVDTLWEKDKAKFYELTRAANYMHIDSLLHLCCAKIASTVKGKGLNTYAETLLPPDSYQKHLKEAAQKEKRNDNVKA